MGAEMRVEMGVGTGFSRQRYWVGRRRNGWRLSVRSAADASDIGVELGKDCNENMKGLMIRGSRRSMGIWSDKWMGRIERLLMGSRDAKTYIVYRNGG